VQPWASCLHTCAFVTKQYNLVPANGALMPCSCEGNRRSDVAWPHVTLITVVVLHLQAQGLEEGDEHLSTCQCSLVEYGKLLMQ